MAILSYSLFSKHGFLHLSLFLICVILQTAIKNDQYDLALLLLRYNAKVNQKGSLQRTALHEASVLGLDHFAYLLLQSGADPNAIDACEHTSLGLAAQAGHFNVVEVLLQKGDFYTCACG